MSEAMAWQAVVRYRKTGVLRFLSHLDVARALERALRRSALPVKYTEGFHRRMRMHLGPALPVGAEGEAELFSFELARRVHESEALARLKAQLPEELSPLAVTVMPARVASPVAQVSWARYEVLVSPQPALPPGTVHRAVESFLAAEQAIVEDPAGKKRPTDVRPRVAALAAEEQGDLATLHMVLGVAEKNYLSPDKALLALEGFLDPPAKLPWRRLVRLELLGPREED